MKSIIDKIKESVEAVIGDGRFYYNDGNGLNIELDNANYPCAFAQLVEAGTVADTLGNYHERIGIGMYFSNVADIDMEAIPNERILTELKKSAFAWLASLRNSDDLTLVEVRNTDRVYIKADRFDVRLTAFVVNVTIEESQGFGVCNIEQSCGCGCS